MVISTSATVAATLADRPSRCSTGARSSDRVTPPNAADRKPARVTPICTADRKRLGFSVSRAMVWPRLPRWASWRIWLSRSDTSAISAAAKMPPIRMKTRINAMLSSTVLMEGSEHSWSRRSAWPLTSAA